MGTNLLMVALGGAGGSILRYLCQKWINEAWIHSFPLATLLVNVSGCLLIGVFYGLGTRTDAFTPQVRLLLVTGFCGGFTTFSTFAFENMHLLRTADYLNLLAYTVLSVVAGVAAVFLGSWMVKLI